MSFGPEVTDSTIVSRSERDVFAKPLKDHDSNAFKFKTYNLVTKMIRIF